MKVLIGTPFYGDIVSSGYHMAVLETIGFFAREFPHIEFVHRLRSSSFVPQVRNVMASQVLADPSFTHLLLIDSDMGFMPELVAKMLAFGKPVVGVIYPERRRSWDAARLFIEKGGKVLEAEVASVDYVYAGDALVTRRGKDGREELEVIDGFVRVRRAGAGMLLVAREALETMRDRLPDIWVAEPEQWVRDHGLATGGFLQCFSVETGSDGIEVGSDAAFSRRWVDGCGGEIWSCADEVVVRSGTDTYLGHFLMRLDAEAAESDTVLVRSSKQG